MLPLPNVFATLQDCVPVVVLSGATRNLQKFTCTPTGVAGTKAGTLKSNPANSYGFDFSVVSTSAAIPIAVTGLTASQTGAGQAISGSFTVAGSSVSKVRVHAGTSTSTPSCYFDLPAGTGAKTFSFSGGWVNENSLSCSNLIPATGSASIVFKVEALDSASNMANEGVAPTVSATWATVVSTCTGTWDGKVYQIGQTEEKLENGCPVGSVGQKRSFHSCKAGGAWSAVAQTDTCQPVLLPPAVASVSSVSSGLQITWSTVSGATGYRIYGSGGAILTDVNGGLASSYIDGSVRSGVNYCYVVSSLSTFTTPISQSNGTSAGCATYTAGPPPLTAPTGVSAAQITGGLRINWGLVSGATSYRLTRQNDNAQWTLGSSTSSYDDLTVMPGISYAYVVQAIRSSEVSPQSAQANAIAPQLPPLTLQGISPTFGSRGQAIVVTVIGTSLPDTLALAIDQVTCTNRAFLSSKTTQQFDCVIPSTASTGLKTVTIKDKPGGAALATWTATFRVN